MPRPSDSSTSRLIGRRRRKIVCAATGAVVAVTTAALVSPLSGTPVSAQSSADDWPTFQHDRTHHATSPDIAPGATAVAASGLTLKWNTFVGGGRSGILSSPAAVYNATLGKELVYAATQGVPSTVSALDAATGTAAWSTTLPNAVRSSPAVDTANNVVYLGAQNHVLYALNATTGATICSYTTTGQLEASPVVGTVDSTGPVVFIGDRGLGETKNAGHEWAINGVGNSNGQCTLKWSFNGFLYTVGGTRTGSWSSSVLAQDANGRWLVVFGTTNPDNGVYAVNAVTGTEAWRMGTVLTGDSDVGAGPTISAPGVNGFADGVVYVDGKDQIEYAADLTTGAAIPGWTNFNLKKVAGIGAKAICTAALVGNNLIISFAQFVFDLNATTGAMIWKSAATGTANFISSPAVSGAAGDQVIFSGDLDGTLYAYALQAGAYGAAGTLLGKYATGSTIISSDAVVDGAVYFGALNGDEYAIG